MSLDRRARRIAEAIGLPYTEALHLCDTNEGLRMTVRRKSTDEEIRAAFRRDGLTQYLTEHEHDAMEET